MIEIRLSDEDRARLGIEQEWLVYNLDRLMAREAGMLYHATRYDPLRLGQALGGIPRFDETGAPVMEDETDDDGNPVLDETGAVKRRQAREIDFEAWRAVVWLATVRAGIALAYKDFDFDILGMITRDPAEEDEVDDEGNAPAPDTLGGDDH